MPDSQQIQSPPPAADAAAEPQNPVLNSGKNGLGVASLILGILAFIGAFIPFINYGSGLLALVGLVIGAVALSRKGKSKGAAIGGVVTSAIAVVLSIILAIVYTAGFVAAVDSSLGTTAAQKADESGQAPAEKDSAEDAPAAAEPGSRANPAPLGSVVELSSAGAVEYEVTLGASTLLANDLVAAANQFNDAAPEGFQYAMVPVTVTYMGIGTGTPWIDLQVKFVSAAGTTHTSSDVSAVDPAPTMMDINELYPDASGTGNVVIAIPTADAALGTWTVSSLFGDSYFFTAQ